MKTLGGGGQLSLFAVGDRVRLITGGPDMAVTAVHDDLVTCMWFETVIGADGMTGWKGANTETFPGAVLEPGAGVAGN